LPDQDGLAEPLVAATESGPPVTDGESARPDSATGAGPAADPSSASGPGSDGDDSPTGNSRPGDSATEKLPTTDPRTGDTADRDAGPDDSGTLDSPATDSPGTAGTAGTPGTPGTPGAPGAGGSVPPGGAGGRRGARSRHPVAAVVTTVLAAALVVATLVMPNQMSRLGPWAFLRLPIEGLAGIVLLMVLPTRPRRWIALTAGVGLGLLTVIKMINIGFHAAFDRPFDPLFDWTLVGDAVEFVQRGVGRLGAIGAVAGVALLVIILLVLVTRSVLRLTRVAAAHRTGTARLVAGLGVIWVVCALLSVHVADGEPIASRTTTAFTYHGVRQVAADIKDRPAFARELAADAYHNTPGADLLTGLRGKDVLMTFVESYGRVAVQGSSFAPEVNAMLDSGTASLAAAGFGARSGFVTSSTYGGGSWLAHSTLESGLWVNNQQRYTTLVASDRLTLGKAFHRAGWRTVGDVPENNRDWPQGAFYGFDKLYDSRNVGYHGPNFWYASVPDQYTLAAFERNELGPGHAPVMAEIDLVTSHVPWAPIPPMLGWDKLGDGSVYNGAQNDGAQPDVLLDDPKRVQTDYGHSVEYSVGSLISWIQQSKDPNLVVVFLGDHQPAQIVSGDNASRDVPITIVAKDPAVLDLAAGWGWTPGLRPDPNAPVWRMDTIRDHLLGTFGPQPSTGR
jgi:hypothetical protein